MTVRHLDSCDLIIIALIIREELESTTGGLAIPSQGLSRSSNGMTSTSPSPLFITSSSTSPSSHLLLYFHRPPRIPSSYESSIIKSASLIRLRSMAQMVKSFENDASLNGVVIGIELINEANPPVLQGGLGTVNFSRQNFRSSSTGTELLLPSVRYRQEISSRLELLRCVRTRLHLWSLGGIHAL